MDNDFNKKHRATVERWLSERNAAYFQVIDNSEDDTVHVKIQPRNPNSCSLSFSSRHGSTQVCLDGSFCFDEVDGWYSDDGEVLTSIFTENRLCSLLDAVWRGAVRERVQRRRGRVTAREVKLSLAEKEFRMRERPLRSLFGKNDEAVERTFEPYDSSQVHLFA